MSSEKAKDKATLEEKKELVNAEGSAAGDDGEGDTGGETAERDGVIIHGGGEGEGKEGEGDE